MASIRDHIQSIDGAGRTFLERCDHLAWQRKHQVSCKADAVTGACKPIVGEWLTIKPFKEMTYTQRQTYLNRVFRLKAKPSAECAA